MPVDLPVIVSDSKTGYEHFDAPYVVDLVHQPDNMYCYGEFQQPGSGEVAEFSALIPERMNRDD